MVLIPLSPDIILIAILYRESEIDLPLVAIFEAGAGIGGSREDLLLLEDKGLLRKGKHHRLENCTDLHCSSELKPSSFSNY